MNSKEFQRWLKKRGCRFLKSRGKGNHITVILGSRKTVVPMHGSSQELAKSLVEKIKRDLGLK